MKKTWQKWIHANFFSVSDQGPDLAIQDLYDLKK